MSQDIPPGAADRAQALVGRLSEGRWEQVRQQFDEQLRGRADADMIARGWRHAAGSVGGFKRAGEPSARQQGDYTVVEVPLIFKGGAGTGLVIYERDGKVAGLSVQTRRRHRLDPRRVGGFALCDPDVAELVPLG